MAIQAAAMSPLGSAAGQPLEQPGALVVGESFGGPQQPAPVDPFRIGLASAAQAMRLGGAPSDLVDHLVRRLDQVETINDQLRVRQRLPRGLGVGRRHVDRDELDAGSSMPGRACRASRSPVWPHAR